MRNLGSTTASRLDRLVDWFIPAAIAAERDSRQRARMFLISHLLGPIIGNSVPLAFYILDPTPGYEVAVLAASITSFWIFPFVLKALGRYNLLALCSIQILIFCILWSCYFSGGVTSPTLPWVLTIPLLAFFYLGPSPSLRLWVLGLFTANLAAFFGLYLLGYTTTNDIPMSSLQGLGIVSTLAASGYVAMMALYYAKILASGVELESEVRGHLSTASELRRATAEAERASAAKAEFLAKMSHELRTPLNAVIGYSQILLEDAADEGNTADAADLEKIHGAGHHLLRLVNEVLDLSKIEAGKMELSSETVDMTSFLEDVTGGFKESAAANGNSLTVHLDRRLGTIECDTKKARQALSQVVENAVKFTQRGRIEISAKREMMDDQEQIVVQVRDTGVGIAEEHLPSLFDKFIVADDASATKYGGAGLGLALSLKLVRLMGGDITVESQLGAGSCFTLRLPVAPPSSAEGVPDDASHEPSSLRTAA